jgi:hypothetical protein
LRVEQQKNLTRISELLNAILASSRARVATCCERFLRVSTTVIEIVECIFFTTMPGEIMTAFVVLDALHASVVHTLDQ